MHGYFWDGARLRTILKEFAGGQFQIMKREEELIFRGEIKSCEVSDNGAKEVTVSFEWLCERTACRKWSLLPQPPPPTNFHRVNVSFKAYYSQPDEERLKMWGGGWGEVCHFFRKDDHTNLTERGGEFVPYCNLHRAGFWIAIALLSK